MLQGDPRAAFGTLTGTAPLRATETVDCEGSCENGLCLFRRDAPIYATRLTDNGAMHRVPSNNDFALTGAAYPDASASDDLLLLFKARDQK